HIELDRTRSCFAVARYHGGMVGLVRIDEDGRIIPAADIHQHEVSGSLTVQDRPRAHSVNVDPDNRFAIACDLGTDHLITYRLDAGRGTLQRVSSVSVAPGAGPRHFAFHPSRPFGY